MIEGFHAADAALFVMDASGGVEAGPRGGRQDRPGDRRRPPASCSTSATARTRTRARRSTRCARPSATRSRRSTSRSAPRTRSAGYVDLVHRKAYRFEGGKEVEIPVPAELADEVARRRDQLLEAAAEADDAVFEKYLGEEEISDAELDACLHKGVRESILAPVLVASAAKGIGLDALLDAIVRYLPSPEEEGPYAATGQGRQGRRGRRRPAASCWSACSRPPPTRSSAG